jgi:hypothetical protein
MGDLAWAGRRWQSSPRRNSAETSIHSGGRDQARRWLAHERRAQLGAGAHPRDHCLGVERLRHGCTRSSTTASASLQPSLNKLLRGINPQA